MLRYWSYTINSRRIGVPIVARYYSMAISFGTVFRVHCPAEGWQQGTATSAAFCGHRLRSIDTDTVFEEIGDCG